MTPEETRSWAGNGFIIVPEALPPSHVLRLKNLVLEYYGRFLRGEISNFSLDNETATAMPELWRKVLAEPRDRSSFKRWNIVADHTDFIELVDHEPVFDRILQIMTANIQLFRSEMIVIPTGVREAAYLHTNSGTLGRCVASPACAPLMVSVQYFLSDLIGKDEGNFACVPGSQHTLFPEEENNPQGDQTSGFVQGRDLNGRIQLKAHAGDAVIFPHSLWHGASANNGVKARLSVIYGYSQLFVRPYDYIEQADEVLDQCRSARQRRLLGDFGSWAWRPGCLHHPAPDQEELIRRQTPPVVRSSGTTNSQSPSIFR